MNKSLVKQSEKRTILHIELLLNKTIQYRYYLVEAYVHPTWPNLSLLDSIYIVT